MKLLKEFDYYERNKDDICDKYEGRYIVIVGEQILGSFVTQMAAIRETMKQHELGEFMVKKVRRKEPILFIPRMIINKEYVND